MTCTAADVTWDAQYRLTRDDVIQLGKEVECCICTDLSDVEKDFALLTCMHTFHAGCVNKWLASSAAKTCPLCRANNVQLQPIDFSQLYQKHKYETAILSGFCAICKSNEKTPYTMLQCAHEWHFGCICKWMLVRRVCPLDNCTAQFAACSSTPVQAQTNKE